MEAHDRYSFAICFFSFKVSRTPFHIRIYRSISFHLLAKFSKIWICHPLFKHFHVHGYRLLPFFCTCKQCYSEHPFTQSFGIYASIAKKEIPRRGLAGSKCQDIAKVPSKKLYQFPLPPMEFSPGYK